MLRKGQKITVIIWYKLLFQSRQRDISLLLTDLPPLLMDVFTIAFGRAQRHLRENPFCVIYHRVTTTHGVLYPVFAFLSTTSLLFNHISLSTQRKKENWIRSPPLTSTLVVKMMQKVFSISAGQHSHTRQIYTVRSCHTCGDRLPDRVVCPSRLRSLQIEPFRQRKVLSLIWPFSRRLGSFDKATVATEWWHEGLWRRRSACLHVRLLLKPDQGV